MLCISLFWPITDALRRTFFFDRILRNGSLKLKLASCGRETEVFKSIFASLKFQYIAYFRAFPGTFDSIQPISLRATGRKQVRFSSTLSGITEKNSSSCRKGKKIPFPSTPRNNRHAYEPATSCCSALLQPTLLIKMPLGNLKLETDCFQLFSPADDVGGWCIPFPAI